MQLQIQTSFQKYLLNDLEKQNSHTHPIFIQPGATHSWEIEAWGSEDSLEP